ncbi:sugar phosphate isomerase/epimerase family protein [Paenibacillus silvisoli]|uniref:sugar phosphate isomerase/epimerase family protein n=1 Tax=Paenibacillus silvisoli TaxID=3110539 RepID=UPI002803E618|nr:sugar phosphate isomerase/epimerase [Paenibacillus silvisoli]
MMRIGLSMFGTTYTMGLHPRAGIPPMTADTLLDTALEAGLQGMELSASRLAGLPSIELDQLAAKAEARNFYITVATDGFDPIRLNEAFVLAKAVGARVVRTVAGGAKFGGDRRHLSGKWQSFMEEVRSGLTAATALAEEAGVILALENHQDLCSEELIALCESIGSPSFGITLDTGNPLATAEEPIAFARKIAPYIKHVHLKDYWMYPTSEGYMLVRCPIGQGAVDFPALMAILRNVPQPPDMSIEIGALEGRHTRVLEDDYWPEYPARSAQQLAELLRFASRHFKPATDWRTPHERGEPAAAVIAYERSQLMSSIAYAHQLMHLIQATTEEQEALP